MDDLTIQLENLSIDSTDSDFQALNHFVTISNRGEYTDHYKKVLNYFINFLNETDALFKFAYRGHDLSGSYADNLKVSRPNEFDTVINLKFVKDNKNVVIEEVKDRPGYVTINVKDCDFRDEELIEMLIDSEGYLIQCKILHWMDRLIKQSLRELKEIDNSSDPGVYVLSVDNCKYKLRYTTSGPASTLLVAVDDTDIEFDMDLVPVCQFQATETFWKSDRPLPTIENAYFLAVPKPLKTDVTNTNRAFITSYACLERHLIKDKNNFKTLIRIFKKIRDTQNLKNLKSYFIKAIFLQHLEENMTDPNYWNQPISKLFKIMFIKIISHLENEELLFYWDKSYNMFGTLRKNQLKSLRETFTRLHRIVQKEDGFVKILLTPEEREKMEDANLVSEYVTPERKEVEDENSETESYIEISVKDGVNEKQNQIQIRYQRQSTTK